MQRGILFFLFFSFSPKKLWNQTSSLKREEKKALNGKRTDEGAEKRKKKSQRDEEKISLEGNYLGYFWKTAFPSSSGDGGNREGLFGSWLEEVEGGEAGGGGSKKKKGQK